MLQQGDQAPAFQLESDNDGTLSLSAFTGSKLVLYFYPKDNTSGWTTEALEFQELLPEFEKLGVKIVGVSRDSLQSHEKFRTKQGITFPLLSDPDHTVHESYGAWGEKKMYGKVVQGVIRSTFVIGPDGSFEHVYKNVKAKGHAQKVLADMKG